MSSALLSRKLLTYIVLAGLLAYSPSNILPTLFEQWITVLSESFCIELTAAGLPETHTRFPFHHMPMTMRYDTKTWQRYIFFCAESYFILFILQIQFTYLFLHAIKLLDDSSALFLSFLLPDQRFQLIFPEHICPL